MNYTLALAICNSVSNCDQITTASSASVITGIIDGLATQAEKDTFWNSYKANYLAVKQRIQTVFANIYAYNRGGYNGAIGSEPAPISLISTFSEYNQSNVSAIERLITTVDNLDDEPIALLYDSKERRFIPSDNNYNSGADPRDALNDIKAMADRRYYVETGKIYVPCLV